MQRRKRSVSDLLEFRFEEIQSLSRFALGTELKHHELDLGPGQQLQAEIIGMRSKRMGRIRQRYPE